MARLETLGSPSGSAKGALARLTPEQVVAISLGALAWGGIVLRSRGVWFGSTIALWEDEAAWAIRLIENGIGEHVIRAPGFMLVSKLSVGAFGASEAALRLAPWLAGVLLVALAPFFARDVLRSSAARVLFVAVLALHPAAIDLAKEFKPYSIALLLHFLLLWAGLRYAQRGELRDLLFATGGALFGVLLSQDLVLAYPGTFGLLALCALRSARWHHVGYLAVGAVACVAVLLFMHAEVAPEAGDMDRAARHWGDKYDVFFVGGAAQGDSRWGWTAARLYEMGALGGLRRELWADASLPLAALQRGDQALWSLLSLGGAISLVVQRRWDVALLLGACLTTLLGFNFFGYWPLGVFRTNLFVLVYVTLLAAFVLEWTPLGARLALVPACVLVLLPYLTLGRTNHARKELLSAHGGIVAAAEELLRLKGEGPRSALVLDGKTCEPWTYYTKYHPAQERAALLTSRFNARCVKSTGRMLRHLRSGLKRRDDRAFVLLGGTKRTADMTKLPRDLRIVEQKVIGRSDALVASIRRRR